MTGNMVLYLVEISGMQDRKLEGQTALVTGANSGIGEGVAIALGAAGANVVVNYVSKPETAETVCQ